MDDKSGQEEYQDHFNNFKSKIYLYVLDGNGKFERLESSELKDSPTNGCKIDIKLNFSSCKKNPDYPWHKGWLN